ncbi:asparaginyl-tRNA synthetase [Xanthomonas citri pv. glycines str. 8ra]|nr:asparaginyl-tRNA synthetase [Xanthomonas citri pv. glycines str. 8ra]
MRDERHAASALTPRSIAHLVSGRDAPQAAAMHCIDLPAQPRTTGAMQQPVLRLGRVRAGCVAAYAGRGQR